MYGGNVSSFLDFNGVTDEVWTWRYYFTHSKMGMETLVSAQTKTSSYE